MFLSDLILVMSFDTFRLTTFNKCLMTSGAIYTWNIQETEYEKKNHKDC